ncbi:MAG TPA: hypothetical protein VIU62_17275 [Chloroflexota bacterium]
MRVGFHTADITPALGMEQPGGYGKSYITAIHDPLKVRAAVLEQDGTALALVGIDTCALPFAPSFMARIRREVEQACGIPGANLLLGASHTHSGGPLSWYDPAEFAGSPDLVQRLARDYSTIPDPLYVDWAARQVVSAVAEAHRKRQEARLSVGVGREEQSSFNRRFKMRKGRIYTHPGKGNPDIIEPAGPIDPEVGVLGAWNSRGELLGCLVNFGCHCTTFSGAISADYVCYLERTIQGVFGQQAEVVFLQGASGDVTQVANQSLRARERESGEASSRLVGTRVGAEAVKVLATAEPGELQPLGALTRTLRLRRRRPGAARLEQNRRLVEEGLAGDKLDTAWTFAKEIVMLDALIAREPEVEVELQALQVGPVVYLANPSETFAETGERLKAGSPFPLTFVVSLANGCAGYVPPASAFAPNGGGYETVLTTYSNLELSAEEQIVAASMDLARQFTPSQVPQPPQVERPGEPWSYGVLGPDVE